MNRKTIPPFRRAATSAWLLSKHMNFQTHLAQAEDSLVGQLAAPELTAVLLVHASPSSG